VIAEPEWTERAEKRGLDPLGMQNAGVALYQELLPGISNVTLRMRYYGYYCWVSDAYARSGATDKFKAWQSWVRRAEALYALVSSLATGQNGVGGVDWANRRLALDEDVIDFAEAASNKDSAARYLRQSLGVFGGAYYSQMVELGLFRLGEHGIQRTTNGLGCAAADAFRESIGDKIETILLQAIKSARITRKELTKLAPIIPSEIPELSSERQAYQNLLFAQSSGNEGDVSRTASLRLILDTARTMGARPSPEDIRWHLFDTPSFRDNAMDAQRVRWETYHCQDLFQVAAAALLQWTTDLMAESDAGRTPAEIEHEIRARLKEKKPKKALWSWRKFREDLNTEDFDYRGAWDSLTSARGTPEQKSWDTVRLIAALDQRLAEREELQNTCRSELKKVGGGRSIVTELEWFGQRAEIPVADLIASYAIERIVRRHSWVAMQKLRRQHDYTFLFEVHEGRLVRRRGYAPVATTPRLFPAVQFLTDIGLVDANGATARGRALLRGNG